LETGALRAHNKGSIAGRAGKIFLKNILLSLLNNTISGADELFKTEMAVVAADESAVFREVAVVTAKPAWRG
jgi:hypothetical protein